MRELILLSAVLIGYSSFAQITYRISGTIVNSGDSRPVKRAVVRIYRAGTAEIQASCVTGADGRFAFENLPAGKFALSAERPNAPLEFFHEHEGYSTAIAIGPGMKPTEIIFPLPVRASISGTVVDEEGDAVRSAQVWLFRRGVLQGRHQTLPETAVQTDGSGFFHFGRLTGGTYVVAVQGRSWYAQNGLAAPGRPTTPELDVAYPVTYYAGTTDPESATPITVTEGDDVTVEIALRAERAVHVILRRGSGEADAGFPMLFAVGPQGYPLPANGVFGGSEQGTQLAGIAPGRYKVAASDSSGLAAAKTVDLTGDSTLDLSDLTHQPADSAEVQGTSGRVKGGTTVEGIAMKDGQPFAGAMVLAVPVDESKLSLLRRDQSDSDGTFSLPQVAPGRYMLIAIDDGRDLAYAEPGVLGPYVKNAQLQEAPVAGASKLEVQVVSRRR